ncbi:NACHT domain-containing protein [Haliscomenobacter hydrossis]|uniref:CHAT domain-containing protein n=1 Tax=Haliscomenobacter hydrossis (strain ATCC 27775 / DSM 1100 / LMG 10767 / O) TaxID=760192 RepID=F4KQV1_HALH1|nr:CHAT domain-containing protein [Haliscomenobacter hydrossis]AEE52236.1 hypothetical protein Halhy_4392 [Haliscomenobacter hydrossis DSM 1100]
MYRLPVMISAFADSNQDLPGLGVECESLTRIFSPLNKQLSHLSLSDVTIDYLLDILDHHIKELVIFHFGGHANPECLLFKDMSGKGKALARLLKSPQLKLVFLNGCKTQTQAIDYIRAGIPAVIVTTRSISDEQALDFAKRFYKTLANKGTLKSAFDRAVGTLELKGEGYSEGSSIYRDSLDFLSEEDIVDAPWKMYVKNDSILDWTIPEFACSYDSPKLKLPSDYTPRKITKIGKTAKNIFLELEEGKLTLLDAAMNNSKIVLLDEAGMGKTTELKHLNNELIEQGKCVLFKSFKEINETWKPDKGIISNSFFILDGLDEGDLSKADSPISFLVRDFPDAHFIASCRSNIYQNSLEGFEPYNLGKFDYKSFVDKHLEGEKAIKAFLDKFATYEYYSLLFNPFFLGHLISFYKENQSNTDWSKTVLLEDLIKKSIDKRLKELDRSMDSELRELCVKSLNLLAFSMECMGKNEIGKDEFDKIVPDKKAREVLQKQSSLIEFRGEKITFSHRIFQEYLAAKVLSKAQSFELLKSIIGIEPDYALISHLWTNTLMYLSELVRSNVSEHKLFFNWLMDKNPNIVVNLDPKSFSKEVRLNFLEKQLDYYAEHYLALLYPYETKLAEFLKDLDIIDILLDRFNPSNNLVNRLNSSLLISELDTYKVIAHKKRVLDYLNQNLKSHWKDEDFVLSECLKILFQHFKYDKTSQELLNDVIFKLESLKNSSNQDIILSFIRDSALQDKYIDILLSLLEKSSGVHYNPEYISNQDDILLSCIEAIKQEESFILFFELIHKSFGDHSQLQKLEGTFKNILKNVRLLSKVTQQKIVNLVGKQILYFLDISSGNFNVQVDLSPEMNLALFRYCMHHDEYNSWIYLGKLVDTEKIPELINNWKTSEKSQHEFQELIDQISIYQPELEIHLLTAINKQYVDEWVIPSKIKHEKLLERSIPLARQFNFDSIIEPYLSFENFSKMITELYEASKENLLGKAFFQNRKNREIANTIWNKFSREIVHELYHFEELISCADYLGSISRTWDEFSHRRIFDKVILSRVKILSPKISEHIKKWCDLISQDFNTSRLDFPGNRIYFSDKNIRFVYYVMLLKLDHYGKDVYQKMIGKNFEYVLANDEAISSIISFIEEKDLIPLNELKTIVLENVTEFVLTGRELEQNLEFVAQYKMTEIIPRLKEFMELQNDDWDTIYSAYTKLEGVTPYNLILLQRGIKNEYHERRVLQDLLDSPIDGFEGWLEESLAIEKNEKKLAMYTNALIILGNVQGFQYLIQHLNREKKMPEFRLKLGQTFNHPEVSDLILDIYELSYWKEIKRSHEIRHFLSTLIDRQSLGKEGYVQVRSILLPRIEYLKKDETKKDLLGRMTMLLNRIDNQFSNQQHKTLDQARWHYDRIMQEYEEQPAG